jgi:cation diffusion facilitator CzcD-associated flavoprotein CzcO
VLVLGVGNSAHDVAQDLHGHGAHVKLIQRGSAKVFSVKAASLNQPSRSPTPRRRSPRPLRKPPFR